MINWLTLIYPLTLLSKSQIDFGVHFSVSDSFILLFFMLLLGKIIIEGNYKIKIGRVYFNVLLLVMIGLFCFLADTLSGSSFNLTFGIIFLWIKIFVFYNFLKSVTLTKNLCRGFFVGTLITLVLIGIETAGFIVIDPTKSPSGTFQNKNNFALYLGTFLIVLAVYEYQVKNVDKRKYLIFSLALLLKLRAFLISQLWYMFRGRLYLLGCLLIPLFLLPGEFNILQLFAAFKSSVMLDDVDNLREVEDVSLGIRFILFMKGVELIQQSPIMGYGSHYFRENMMLFDKNLSPHNTYILLWVEGGMVAVGSYFLLIVHNLRKEFPISSITLMIAIWSLFSDLITRELIAMWLAFVLNYEVRQKSIRKA